MQAAYVFINTEKGFEKGVLNRLRKLPNVKESYLTNGAYNIITKIDVDSIDNLKKIIAFNIRLQDNVESTLTMMIVERKSDATHLNRKVAKIHADPIANNQGAHALVRAKILR